MFNISIDTTVGFTFFGLEDDIVHYVCCENEYLRLCGESTNAEGFTDDEVTCEPCKSAYKNHICPEGKICTGWDSAECN